MADRKISRRRIIATGAAAGIGAAANVMADSSTQPATQQSHATAAATRPADPITIADVAAADKLAARDYLSDDERKLMLDSLETYRKRLRKFRGTGIDPRIEPAVHFDPRLPDTKLPTAGSSCRLSQAPLPDYDGHVESLAFATVADLARLIQARKVTSAQLTRMYLDRLKRFGPRLLCVVNLTESLAMSQAQRADEEIAAGKYRGPLHGIPYGAKDLLATKDAPTTWGVAPYKSRNLDFNATVIEKLQDAGAVLVAKLSLGELAMGDVWFGGKTRTPWNTREGSSGSSAGPGAATAAGLVGFSIGSETLGSIISPCVVNGTTGLRPTWGRVSRYGAMPLTWTMDKLGPMCRCVEDCALVLAAIHGADGRDPTAADVPFLWDPTSDLKTFRVGYDAAAFDWKSDRWKDAALARLYREAFDSVRSIVGEMTPIHLPPAEKYSGLAGTIIAVESASSMADLLTSGQIRDLVQQDEGSWPNTFRVGGTVPAADYLRVMRLRTLLMREMAEALHNVDLFLTVPYAGPTLAFTNLTGHPSLITRCGIHEGRPKMFEFVGQLYREDAICRVALAYERGNNWWMAHPKDSAVPQTPPG